MHQQITSPKTPVKLVEKIEIISPTHFAFILKSGLRVKEKKELPYSFVFSFLVGRGLEPLAELLSQIGKPLED
jgi:hypothetical protein